MQLLIDSIQSRPAFATLARTLIAALLATGATASAANGIGENGSWQFQSNNDRATRSAVVDMVQRKRGGYYDGYHVTTINNTVIERQYNCALTTTATGNVGSNGMTASTSSPLVTNSGSTSSGTSANGATNSIGYDMPGLSNLGAAGRSRLGSNQSNTGALGSSVVGSSTTASTGAVTAGGGRSNQVLNSEQSNLGGHQVASITGSTACAVSPN